MRHGVPTLIVDWTKQEAREVANKLGSGEVKVQTEVRLSEDEAHEVAEWVEGNEVAFYEDNDMNEDEEEMVRLDIGETLEDEENEENEDGLVRNYKAWEDDEGRYE